MVAPPSFRAWPTLWPTPGGPGSRRRVERYLRARVRRVNARLRDSGGARSTCDRCVAAPSPQGGPARARAPDLVEVSTVCGVERAQSSRPKRSYRRRRSSRLHLSRRWYLSRPLVRSETARSRGTAHSVAIRRRRIARTRRDDCRNAKNRDPRRVAIETAGRTGAENPPPPRRTRTRAPRHGAPYPAAMMLA